MLGTRFFFKVALVCQGRRPMPKNAIIFGGAAPQGWQKQKRRFNLEKNEKKTLHFLANQAQQHFLAEPAPEQPMFRSMLWKHALWSSGSWLAAHTLGQSGHCVPKSGSHALQRMAPPCPSLVWGHPSCKVHAGMPHHLDFFKM